jgi:ABC-type transport system involved in multi-copper enzyme maturation permease subunit
MSALVGSVRRSGGWVGGRVANFWAGISAVGIKELRGRMRGRRAFVVVTIYLALLSLLAFAVYIYLKQTAVVNSTTTIVDPGFGRPGLPFPGEGNVTASGTALSAAIGHAMFGALLAVETLLIMVLAPAFTTGAISLEREKQTLDLLVTTPLSTLGMVVGKLISALSYVFLLIIASIPLASLVFVFGAVGPEDLVRGYLVLFAVAFGMGALGLFISALTKRTQTATVLTYVLVLTLTVGTVALHQFWLVASRRPSTSSLVVTTRPFNAPEALLYLNPFAADADLVCTTAPGADHLCEYMSQVTGKPYFGTPTTNGFDDTFGIGGEGVGIGAAGPGIVVGADGVPLPVANVAVCPPNAKCVVQGGQIFCPDNGMCAAPVDAADSTLSLGFPRDTFWPKSTAAFLAMGLLLTFASAQLVAPTRRWRLRGRRLGLRRKAALAASSEPAETETLVEASSDLETPVTETPA